MDKYIFKLGIDKAHYLLNTEWNRLHLINKRIELTPLETKMVECLVKNINKTIKKDEIIEYIYGIKPTYFTRKSYESCLRKIACDINKKIGSKIIYTKKNIGLLMKGKDYE